VKNNMALEFTEDQGKIFDLLLKKQEALDTRDIVAQTGVDQPLVTATLNSCQEQGWVTIEEKEREELVLADDALEQVDKGLPERQVISLLAKEGKIKIRDLVGILKEKDIMLNEVIKWGQARAWLSKEKDEILLAEAGKKAVDNPADDEKAIRAAVQLNPQTGTIFLD
jgi:hypothetical protein